MKKTAIQYYLKCAAALAGGLGVFLLSLFWGSFFVRNGAGLHTTLSTMHAGELLLSFVAAPLVILVGLLALTHALALCIRWRAAK